MSANNDTKTQMDHSIAEANKMWANLKKRIADDPTFVEKPDSEKIDIYQKSEFKDFYINFPIVSRYMICMGQFSNKAFKRFLTKCSKAPRNSSNAEDSWIHLQADYIRYLWESYQPPHFKMSDAAAIWQQAYKMLTDEFKDFKKMHKDIEEKLKANDKLNKAEMVRELLKRVANEEQTLDSTATEKLVKRLEAQLAEQKAKS
jgi:hypothetical protein